MIGGLNPRAIKIDQPAAQIGEQHIYSLRGDAVFNPQQAPRESRQKDLSGQGASLGELPRQPAPGTITYMRTPRDDVMAGYRPPEPNARGHFGGPLAIVPVLKRVPRPIYTFR